VALTMCCMTGMTFQNLKTFGAVTSLRRGNRESVWLMVVLVVLVVVVARSVRIRRIRARRFQVI
jgi:hypothetical protein